MWSFLGGVFCGLLIVWAVGFVMVLVKRKKAQKQLENLKNIINTNKDNTTNND